MKSKNIQLLFLLLAGVIIGWREWNRSPILPAEDWSMLNAFSSQEPTLEWLVISGLVLVGGILYVLTNHWQGPGASNMSSPNSV